MKVFLDTGGLVAAFHDKDSHFASCSAFWKSIPDSAYRPVLTDYILDELTTFLIKKASHEVAIKVLQTLLSFVNDNSIELVWIDEGLFERGKKILETYNDKSWSFTDCTSFAVCERQSIKVAFAVDHDFAQFGLRLVPAR